MSLMELLVFSSLDRGDFRWEETELLLLGARDLMPFIIWTNSSLPYNLVGELSISAEGRSMLYECAYLLLICLRDSLAWVDRAAVCGGQLRGLRLLEMKDEKCIAGIGR